MLYIEIQHDEITYESDTRQDQILLRVIPIFLSEIMLNQISPILDPISSISETGSMETLEISVSVLLILVQNSKLLALSR